MTLTNAFTAAWKDLKAAATKVTAFLEKQQPLVQQAVGIATTVASIAAPSAVPVITEMDSLEEAVVGALSAAAQDTTKESTLSALLGDLWEPFKSVVQTLESHPSVASVTAALKAVPSPATAAASIAPAASTAPAAR
jgi:hypothetical protein